MTLGRMIHFYHPYKTLMDIKAASMAKFLVWLDVILFIVQGTGVAILSSNPTDPKALTTGSHMYMAGIGVQQFFIVLFIGLVSLLQRQIIRLERTDMDTGRPGWQGLCVALYIVMALISVRAPPTQGPSGMSD